MAVSNHASREFFKLSLPLASYVDDFVLAANVAETVTVPSLAQLMNVRSDVDLWTRTGGTASVPAADVTDGTGSALNVGVRLVYPGQTFSIVAGATCHVSIEWFLRPAGAHPDA